eukprot:628296_1
MLIVVVIVILGSKIYWNLKIFQSQWNNKHMETILITIITFRTDQQTHIIHDIKCNIISIISVTSTYGNISSFNGTKAEEVYYQFKYLWNAYYPTHTNNIITYISYTNNMMTYKYLTSEKK